MKIFKPNTPGTRRRSVESFDEITKKKRAKSLSVSLGRTGGRNSSGHLSVRHKGGGHKRAYRIIDFKRDKFNIPGKVIAIEYDPNRSARIALVQYSDGEKRYILHPLGLKVGRTVLSGEEVDVKVGNTMSLRKIPMGTFIHNIELRKGTGGQLARSAGSFVQLMAKEGDYAYLRLPSGELRLVHLDCAATVGQMGNTEHENVIVGKAGRSRWMGIRPTVRGTAMNKVDHPHGGGRGKSKGGRHPVSPWGQLTKGYKTRRIKSTEKWIIKHRVSKRKNK